MTANPYEEPEAITLHDGKGSLIGDEWRGGFNGNDADLDAQGDIEILDAYLHPGFIQATIVYRATFGTDTPALYDKLRDYFWGCPQGWAVEGDDDGSGLYVTYGPVTIRCDEPPEFMFDLLSHDEVIDSCNWALADAINNAPETAAWELELGGYHQLADELDREYGLPR
jgi:hypothetical protein